MALAKQVTWNLSHKGVLSATDDCKCVILLVFARIKICCQIDSFQNSGKLEKAEILEMTVQYLRALHSADFPRGREKGLWNSYNLNFSKHYINLLSTFLKYCAHEIVNATVLFFKAHGIFSLAHSYKHYRILLLQLCWGKKVNFSVIFNT